MFSKAIVNHELSVAKAASNKQHPLSSSPVQTELKAKIAVPISDTARPLSYTSANIIRNGGVRHPAPATSAIAGFVNHKVGLKRNASHLAKGLGSQHGFDGDMYTDMGFQQVANGTPGRNSAKRSKVDLGNNVFFDENDFDSDVDLDVEEPTRVAAVHYPSLTAFPRQEVFKSPAAPLTRSPKPSQSSVLPWSSSPLEHFQKPNIGQFAYQAPGLPQGAGPQVIKPSKRRTLPWLEEDEDPIEIQAPTTALQGQKPSKGKKNKVANTATPAGKGNHDPAYLFNTTASAIKEQQKKLREGHKKLVKNNSVPEEATTKTVSSRKKTRVARVFLSDEQQHVLGLVTEKSRSVFFTGSAGTGKSVLLREIIAAFRKKYSREPDRVAVTASTGLAACNVGGVTLHSFAGIGLGKEGVQELVKKIKRNQKARHRWLRTKVLIIDEISMVDAELFDKLEEVARRLRNNGRPFGGIQLVITGDFFQLPPVPDGPKRETRFCFDAHTWNTTIEHTIGLHHVFRQKDPVFASMLNEMREGRLSAKSIAKFRTLSRELNFEDDLEATELFPTRAEVERANQGRLQHLRGEVQVFEAKDGGSLADKMARDKLLQNCMAPEKIILKKGAQVMLIKNIDETLVNGSLGRVIGFMSEAMFDNYQQHEEDYYTAQAAGGDEDGPPGLNDKKTRPENMLSMATQFYPVVRFTIADGSTRDLLCQRESWKVELPNGEVQASRAQIPLILAWALSIHKAQGQTLERVKVDLGRVFEKGQAYVALSRATSMAGLQVTRFDPAKVVAHDKVRNFYSKLSRAEIQNAEIKQEKAKPQVVAAQDYEKTFVDEDWEV